MAELFFKGRHFQQDMIMQSIRWYLAYSLNYRDIEELMQERGFSVNHSTINRWVIHYSPRLEAVFRRKGNTIDFLLTAKRDAKAALRFLRKAINENGKPSLVNIDQGWCQPSQSEPV